jgi:hypothetical protein
VSALRQDVLGGFGVGQARIECHHHPPQIAACQ